MAQSRCERRLLPAGSAEGASNCFRASLFWPLLVVGWQGTGASPTYCLPSSPPQAESLAQALTASSEELVSLQAELQAAHSRAEALQQLLEAAEAARSQVSVSRFLPL